MIPSQLIKDPDLVPPLLRGVRGDSDLETKSNRHACIHTVVVSWRSRPRSSTARSFFNRSLRQVSLSPSVEKVQNHPDLLLDALNYRGKWIAAHLQTTNMGESNQEYKLSK
jgi:hypothetical protein